MVELFKTKKNIDLESKENKFAFKQLEREVEKVKIALSDQRISHVKLMIRGKEYEQMITRKNLNEWGDKVFKNLMEVIDTGYEKSGRPLVN
jgi:molecular chaperone DnaK (HSP70)